MSSKFSRFFEREDMRTKNDSEDAYNDYKVKDVLSQNKKGPIRKKSVSTIQKNNPRKANESSIDNSNFFAPNDNSAELTKSNGGNDLISSFTPDGSPSPKPTNNRKKSYTNNSENTSKMPCKDINECTNRENLYYPNVPERSPFPKEKRKKEPPAQRLVSDLPAEASIQKKKSVDSRSRALSYPQNTNTPEEFYPDFGSPLDAPQLSEQSPAIEPKHTATTNEGSKKKGFLYLFKKVFGFRKRSKKRSKAPSLSDGTTENLLNKISRYSYIDKSFRICGDNEEKESASSKTDEDADKRESEGLGGRKSELDLSSKNIPSRDRLKGSQCEIGDKVVDRKSKQKSILDYLEDKSNEYVDITF